MLWLPCLWWAGLGGGGSFAVGNHPVTPRSLSPCSGHRRVPGEQHDGRGRHAAPRRGKWWILTSKSQCLSLSVCDWYCRVLPLLGILGSTSLSQHCRCSPLTPRVHLRPELSRVHGSAISSCCWVWLVGSYTFMAVTEEKMLVLDSPLLEKNIMEDRLAVCSMEASRCGDSTNDEVSCSFSRNVS